MPIVGIESLPVTRAATRSGIASRTSAKQPASSSLSASSRTRRAASAVGALDAVSAERADGLRREAEVPHDGDARLDDRADRARALAAALELHGVHPAVREEAARVADGLGDVGLVREERQVADPERGGARPRDGARVVEHVVHRDAQRVVVAEDDHAERVADEDRVDAGRVRGLRGRVVVRRDHDDGLAAGLLRVEGARRDARRGGGDGAHRCLLPSEVRGVAGGRNRERRACPPGAGRAAGRFYRVARRRIPADHWPAP